MVRVVHTVIREEQARETRAAMINAATVLFLEKGYAGTSIRAVAERARVGEQTVYRVFGNKPTLLRDAILAAVSGSDSDDENWDFDRLISAVRAGATPLERLRVVGEWSAGTYERGSADLEEIVFAAAQTDSRLEELAEFIREQRYRSVRALVEAVAGEAGPPPEMDLDDIADFIYATWSGPVYRQLVGDRGWTTERYITWCVRMVERMFLDDLTPRE
jgi:TetR/AcrR family transcriptional regulator, regulator of autoinduction and epiphytic fitness